MDEIKAERDEMRPAGRVSRAKREPRLAYEIALGIIIAGVTLWTLEMIVSGLVFYLALKGIKVHFGG